MTFEQKKQLVIDNCFKVDCNINMTLKEAYEKGFNRGLSKAPKSKVEQPQGEWIIIDDTEQFIVKCSVCGRIEDSRMVKDYPFCHCGAKMRKGDTNDG